MLAEPGHVHGIPLRQGEDHAGKVYQYIENVCKLNQVLNKLKSHGDAVPYSRCDGGRFENVRKGLFEGRS